MPSVTIEDTAKISYRKRNADISRRGGKQNGQEDIDWLCKKIVNLRIFDDEVGVMNKSYWKTEEKFTVIQPVYFTILPAKGNVLLISKAAKPEISVPLYEKFCKDLRTATLGKKIGTGTFGAEQRKLF